MISARKKRRYPKKTREEEVEKEKGYAGAQDLPPSYLKSGLCPTERATR